VEKEKKENQQNFIAAKGRSGGQKLTSKTPWACAKSFDPWPKHLLSAAV